MNGAMSSARARTCSGVAQHHEVVRLAVGSDDDFESAANDSCPIELAEAVSTRLQPLSCSLTPPAKSDRSSFLLRPSTTSPARSAEPSRSRPRIRDIGQTLEARQA